MSARKSVSVEFSPRWAKSGEVALWEGLPTGEPLRVFDRVEGCAVRVAWGFRCEVVPYSGGYTLFTCGSRDGGRRFRRFASFSEAVTAGEHWASRRFAYLREGES